MLKVSRPGYGLSIELCWHIVFEQSVTVTAGKYRWNLSKYEFETHRIASVKIVKMLF